MDAKSISLSGMQAAAAQMNASASNIANMRTPGYAAVGVAQNTDAGGGVTTHTVSLAMPPDLAADMVSQHSALMAYKANVIALNAQDNLLKVAFDLIG